MIDKSPGQMITFYSYKGGTGRTMALANVACLLARRQAEIGGKGVLMIDWDLEAPGLHRYFHNKLKRIGSVLPDSEDAIDDAPGLIDIFMSLDEASRNVDTPNVQSTEMDGQPLLTSEKLAVIALDTVQPERYALQTKIEGLHLIKAGRFNKKDPEEYSRNVNTFQWENLYRRSPMLIRTLAERLAAKYQYVLIDSRTGITDISGICTMLLPEKLVVVFTPNHQSIRGGLELIRRATEYRKESHDLRPLTVFPLVSRVEYSEKELKEKWRLGDNNGIPGYQLSFEKLFNQIYRRADIKLAGYFDEMQIPHVPYFAYGEEIAVLTERTSDRFSLRRSYDSFASRLVNSKTPWGKIDEVDAPQQESKPSLSDSLRFVTVNVWRRRTSLLGASLFAALLLATFAWWQWRGTDRRLRESETQRASLVEQRVELDQQLQSVQDELAMYKSKPLADLVEDQKKLLDEKNRGITQLSDQIRSYSKQATDLQAKVQSLDGENVSQKATLKQLNGVLNTARQQLLETKSNLDRTNSDWQSAQLSNRNCEYQRDSSEKKLSILQAQIRQAQTSADSCSQENIKLDRENRLLKATCKQPQSKGQ